MVELGKRKPMLSPAFGVGHPMEGCLKPSSNPGELDECRLAFQAAFELLREKCGV